MDDLGGTAWAGLAWTTPPAEAAVRADGSLTARSAAKTDFWQRTFYGFQRDDGHALLAPRGGDFTATLTFEGRYRELYDQAGLMLWSGPANWIKFGVELTDGRTHLSVVVTDGASDWSAQPIGLDGPLTVRATRLGTALLLQHGSDADGWHMARLAPITAADVSVGPYLCSPERAGFQASFLRLAVTDPLVRALHG